ncbi:hypothetical protein ACU62C_02560 [Klebsiella aerogenes]
MMQTDGKVQRTSLTQEEFSRIAAQLQEISQTWFDLWIFLHVSIMETRRALSLTFADCALLPLSQDARAVVIRRQCAHPDDIWLFQSHSNRVKFRCQPVSHTAFNQAIYAASSGVTDKPVSSKHARRVIYDVKDTQPVMRRQRTG